MSVARLGSKWAIKMVVLLVCNSVQSMAGMLVGNLVGLVVVMVVDWADSTARWTAGSWDNALMTKPEFV